MNTHNLKGQIHGPWKTDNGSFGSYINGNAHGYFELYFDNGRLADCGLYDNDFKVGYWKHYNSKGQSKQMEFYL